MLGKLVPCGGGAPLPLLKTKLIVGRKPECDLTVPCPTVSSRHCSLEFEDGSWWVRDLQSKNGTAVNGRRCENQRLGSNDVLSVGRQRFVVDLPLVKKLALTSARHDADEDLALEFLNEASENAPSPKVVPAPMPASNATMPSQPAPISLANATPQSVHPTMPKATDDLGQLVPCGGGVPIPLRYPQLILGRSSECDIRIRFPSVSSRHCKLSFDEGYWLVEDLNSTNGTWVDGDRCLLQCIFPDSVLALDKHRFKLHYVPRGDGPPPVVRQLFTQSLLEKAGLANAFSGNRLAGQTLPDDDFDRPKRYDLLDPDNE